MMLPSRFEAGDVVVAPDPYHDDDPRLLENALRPWLVLSGRTYPHQGEDYVCCALTSNTRLDPNTVDLSQSDWTVGSPRRPSRVDPQTVMTVKHKWIVRFAGRIAVTRLNRARTLLKSYL